MKKYYRRIRDLREDRDWTQTQIAEMLHVTQKVYSNYETGRTLVPSDILIELADIHGTSMDYLAERTDSPYFEKITYISGDIRQTVTSLSDSDQP
jgi:transcriptional regulator with XRE-family HTH domain